MRFDFTELTSRKKIVVVLALLTGLLHLLYGVTSIYIVRTTMDYFFILNFVGNVFFIVILYFTPELEDYHIYFRWGFIAYTLSSIIAYVVTFAPGGIRQLLLPAGLFDKILEMILIVFLIIDTPLEPEERYENKNNRRFIKNPLHKPSKH